MIRVLQKDYNPPAEGERKCPMNFQWLLVLPCVSVSAARTTVKTERLLIPKVCWDEQTRDQLTRADVWCLEATTELSLQKCLDPFPWWWGWGGVEKNWKYRPVYKDSMCCFRVPQRLR